MKTKKVACLMMALTMLCGGAAMSASAEELTFGYLVSDMSHEWYQNIVKGAQSRAAEVGVELLTADAAMDVTKQISQAENMITQGVDALIITPIDVNKDSLLICMP